MIVVAPCQLSGQRVLGGHGEIRVLANRIPRIAVAEQEPLRLASREEHGDFAFDGVRVVEDHVDVAGHDVTVAGRIEDDPLWAPTSQAGESDDMSALVNGRSAKNASRPIGAVTLDLRTQVFEGGHLVLPPRRTRCSLAPGLDVGAGGPVPFGQDAEARPLR